MVRRNGIVLAIDALVSENEVGNNVKKTFPKSITYGMAKHGMIAAVINRKASHDQTFVLPRGRELICGKQV